MILGHDQKIQFFKERFKSTSFHHAWLLKGPRGVGKFSCALNFSKYILQGENMYGNLKIISSQDCKNIPVEDVRHSLDFLTQTTLEGGWKVLIIDSLGLLNRHSQNALLKSLEEPRPKTLFLLILQNGEKILPTISSRCISLNFNGLEQNLMFAYIQEKHPSLESAKGYIELSCGSIGRLDSLISKEGLQLYENIVSYMLNHKFATLAQLVSKHTPLFLSEIITIIYHRGILFNQNHQLYPIYERESQDLKSLFKIIDWRKIGNLFTRLYMSENLNLESSNLFIEL